MTASTSTTGPTAGTALTTRPVRAGGDLDQARKLHQETLTIARSSGDENLRAEAHYLLAIDFMAAGDAGSAVPHLAAAVRHYQNLDHFEGLTAAWAHTAQLAAGRSQAIDDALTAALPILQDRQPVATR
jgi:hypothetical protein